ncbi:hypothetical protein AK830_g12694 [Neonectria ditissima]|uniref:NAD(P)-binding domain-containing protein n=1 Tax=Neonectria ditissima TaxID=78410 RepID=A0A0P7B4Y1_9HYPO|nr:hypothetical protein AK830_g12694 [Neonectria ditissima]
MKVIVTGATGLVGKEMVRQCLADPRITKVVILTRRAVSMDVESHPKTEVVMHQDFSRYSDDLLRRLQGASACLWAIGGKPDQQDADKDMLHGVSVEFPLAAAKAMSDAIAAKAPAPAAASASATTTTKFNFVFCSPKSASPPSKAAALLFLSDPRRQRGEAEKGLCDLADANPESFAVWILRPAAVGDAAAAAVPKRRRLVGRSSSAAIDAPQLARAAVKVALEGWKDRVVDNDALLKM